MDLQAFQQKLKKQLEQNEWIIQDEACYSIPVHTVEVRYHPIQRSAMDILMNMMLISYERARIKQPEVLADILLVEPLFIHDLTTKMIHLGMLTKADDGVIQLTAKGTTQKENGIFEEQLELQTEQLYYSPTHNAFLTGDVDSVSDIDELPEPFPYAVEELGEINTTDVINRMTERQAMLGEETPQTFITEIESMESVQMNDIPCVQFICYEKKTNQFFVKVYNTLTAQWDESIEQLIATNERTTWSSKYL